MISFSSFRRPVTSMVLPAALVVALAASGAQAQGKALTEDEILKAKCTLCHSSERVFRIKADQIRPVLERMRKMNPDWITQVESDHVAEVLARALGDSSAVAMREAWFDAVGRGEKLYNDASLGTTGKSCASCHAVGSLRNVEDAFPKFNADLKRFVDIQEAINLMIQEKMKGSPLPPNDQKYIDLLSYLKSLK